MGETYLRLASIFPFCIPAIRDYIDILNNAYDSVYSDINLQQVLQQSFLFIIGTIKFTVIYFLSFQWIQDLTYLPILVPQLKIEILKEHFFLQTPQSNFFTFLEIPSYINNKFLLGFFNSFFLCLPLSVAHIISVRRLLIQGLAAGISSNLGTICGQVLLLICILFGGRFFISPWFNFQVLNYFFGVYLVLNIVYDMAHERSIRIIDISNKSLLIKIFLLNFALAWTEQSCIFQYFGNLTLGAEPTIIEIFSSPTELQSILTHSSYIIGITIGSLIFTSSFIFICLKMSNFVVEFSSIPYTRWIRRLNFSLITLIIAFTFTSIPFYSIDYLVLSNLGVVSQDKNLKNTVFIPTKTHDFSPVVLGDSTNSSLDHKPGIDTNITPFDKGRYLMFDANDSFEQLNYRGEYAWLTKKHRTPTVSRDPSSFKVLSNFSKFFQKAKKTSRSGTNTSTFSDSFTTDQQNKQSKKKNEENTFENNTSIIDSQNFVDNEVIELDSNNSINILHSRRENERKINEFFENMINISVQNRFTTHQQVKKPVLEKKFKQKYYSNPIYKLLLSADIDFFLSRQPHSFALHAKQENDLFEKRLVLANYYDSLRYYNKLPYLDEFQDVFNGSKSYADRIYNQQFKGTLKIVRRLFFITLNNFQEKKNTNSSEKQAFNSITNSFDTQEKSQSKITSQNQNFPFFAQSNENNVDNLILKFDQPLYKKTNIYGSQNKQSPSEHENDRFHPIFHEEFRITKKISNKEYKTKFNTPFIQLTNPIPFYVGWDEQLRKLVITNRLSPRYSASHSMKFFNKTSNNDYPMLNNLVQKSKTIEFTTWPIPKNILEKLKSKSIISYNLLFNSSTDLQNKSVSDQFKNFEQKEDSKDLISIDDFGTIKTIPLNIAKNGGKMDREMEDIVPYTRGGFVWPGHSNLKFKFKNLNVS